MDFEQMQVVWDEQKKQRVYALDLEALHASVRRRGRRIARGVELMEIGLVVILLAMSAFLALKPMRGDTRAYTYVSIAVQLAVAAYVVGGRLKRRARERAFAPNLLGDIDLALEQVNYHIRRIRTFPLWFCGPLFLTVALGLALEHDSKPSWLWLLVFAAFPLSVYVARLELKCLHLPRKRELEALRAKLTNEN